jgi:hypothetical protein
MAGKAQYWPVIAANGPEIVDIAKSQCLALKANGFESLDHQCLTTIIIRGYRAAFNQVKGELQGGGQSGHYSLA